MLPSSLIQAWDWHCQSAASGGVKTQKWVSYTYNSLAQLSVAVEINSLKLNLPHFVPGSWTVMLLSFEPINTL